MKEYPNASRLVIAVDMNFHDCKTPKQVQKAARSKWKWAFKTFGPLGVTLKGNSVVIHAGLAWALKMAKKRGVKVFVDLKMFDVMNTIINTTSGMKQATDTISIVTVAERVNPKTFTAIRELLPNTVICPVNPLSDLDDAVFKSWGEGTRSEAVATFFDRTKDPTMDPCDGTVSGAGDLTDAPKDYPTLKKLVCPGIRPTELSAKANGPKDVTLEKARDMGAAFYVIGGSIMGAEDPYLAATHCLDVIHQKQAA